MVLKSNFNTNGSQNNACEAVPTVNFSSFEELIDTVKSGKLTEEQLSTIYIIKGGNTDFEIELLDNLVNLNINEEAMNLRHVAWNCRKISYELYIPNTASTGVIEFYTKEDYNKVFEKYENFNVNDYPKYDLTLLKSDFANGGESIIITNEGSYAFKTVVYSFKEGDRTFIVEKTYQSKEGAANPLEEFEDIPWQITVNFQENNIYYYLFARWMTKDITDEQLLGFGIKN